MDRTQGRVPSVASGSICHDGRSDCLGPPPPPRTASVGPTEASDGALGRGSDRRRQRVTINPTGLRRWRSPSWGAFLAIGAAAVAATGSNAVAQYRSVPACVASDMRVARAGGGAAAGHVGTIFRVKNVSGASCHLKGYPTLVQEHANGRSISTPISHDGGYLYPRQRPHEILLPRLASVYFAIETYTGAKACPTSAEFFRLRLPGSRRSRRVHAALGVCPANGPGIVTPLLAHKP